MVIFASRQAAKQMVLDPGSLSSYMSAGKIANPKTMHIGGPRVYPWTERGIKRVRELLPRIKKGTSRAESSAVR